MPLRLLATSDIHLGMKFTGYPEVQEELCEARFLALESLVGIANDRSCDMIVIAGDLFDRLRVTKHEITRAREILGEFEGSLVAVLPGNHDFITPGESPLWDRFRESTTGIVLVCADPASIDLLPTFGIDAILYPGPCTSKHSSHNAIQWIPPTATRPKRRHHIGIAHGSIEGLSPDFQKNYYPMSPQELIDKGLDLWIIGHTHRPWTYETIYNPGTPEPDGFDCDHPGSAMLLTIDDQSGITHEQVPCGTYRFEHARETLRTGEDVRRLVARYNNEQSQRVLLKMSVSGRLSREDYDTIRSLRATLSTQVMHLASFRNSIRQAITRQDIDTEFTRGSFPHRLLSVLAEREDDAEALQVAYDLLGEVRP